jgi:hypothetical protein
MGLPDPGPLVRDMDPKPSIIKQKKKEKHRFLLYLFLKNDVNVPSKSTVISKKT